MLDRIVLTDHDSSEQFSKYLTFGDVIAASDMTGGVTDVDGSLPDIFDAVYQFAGGATLNHAIAVRNHIDGSTHYSGDAMDIGLTADQLATLRTNVAHFLAVAYGGDLQGMRGFGTATWGVHVDTDGSAAFNRWSAPGDVNSYVLRHWAETGASTWLVNVGTSPSPASADVPGNNIQVLSEIQKQYVASVASPWAWIIAIFLLILWLLKRKK